MNSKDYIPESDAAFLAWAKTLIAGLAAGGDGWGISEAAVERLQAELTEYERAQSAAEDPNRGKADVFAKNETRNTLKTDIRAVVKSHVAYNEAVTDDDRVRMGLPTHGKKPTPVPAPSTRPIVSADTSVPLNVKVNFHSEGGRGKPEGAHGAEIRWVKRETPPESLDDLSNSVFSTRSPYELSFDLNERGKKLFIAARWENTTGEKGPWSDVIETAVP
ncbi:hypothetical protein [Treponema endosymbiont of Eucomonympha sp.]|uniref:hypothetical protein n=1 Tax=Treponema endosymbiont of Eucomonympha sp. TaxID=1580831 RepID=UPI00075173EC|nr:hypothetical protein [Treponema endosymbiont of Eucomonympha sp.]